MMNCLARLVGLAFACCACPASAETLNIGGVTRTFTAQLADIRPAPLVIVLHGNTQSGADMATRTSWPGAAHPLIRLLVTDITSSNARMIAICAVSP